MRDLIDRQAAIRWVKTECNPYGEPTIDFESGKKVIEHLKQMPSADQNRWIPCSERLPEKPKPNPDLDDKPLGLYLVCAKGGTPFRAFWNGKTFADGWSRLEVDAWMPLPEPWRGEEDD